VPTDIFVVTLLVTGVLLARKVRGAILIGLVTGTVIAVAVEAIWHLGSATEKHGGWSLSVPTLSGSPFAVPDLSLVGAFSFGSVERVGVMAAAALVVVGAMMASVLRKSTSPSSQWRCRWCSLSR
jgi:AGZA family xanthine/uracil permease-like MFS transporter